MSNGYQSPVDQPGQMIGGRERYVMDYAEEDWLESLKFKEESQAAEGARGVEDERKLWWSVGLGLLGSLFGPIGVPIGMAVGKIVGELGTVGGKQAEDYLVSTDVGKYEKQRQFELEEFNRNLQTYDKGQLWTDIMDIGKAGLFSFKMGIDPTKGISSFDPFKWGGQEGKGSTEILGEAWKRLFPNR